MNLLRRHLAALLLALALGVFVGSVLTLGEKSVPGFAGVYKQSTDDQLYYLVRAHEVLDGHFLLSNPYLAEQKESVSAMQVWLPDSLLALPLGVFGISVQDGYLAYAFFFPALLFLLTYAIAFLLTRSRVVSVLTALVLHAGLFLVTLIRLPSPQFNFIFFELLLLALLLYLETGKQRYALIAAASFGLLFYLYPYFWTYAAATLGLFIILGYFVKCDIRMRGILALTGGGIALGGYYFWATLTASHIAFSAETLARVGLIHTHFPSGFQIVGVALLVLGFGIVAYRRSRRPLTPQALMLLSGTLAAIVVVNQQVITGSNIEFSSHYFLPSIYWGVLSLVYFSTQLIAQTDVRVLRRVLLGVFSVVVALGCIRATTDLVAIEFASTTEDHGIQNYAPIFDWLTTHTKKDDVVFADSLASEYIPAYTANNVYSSKYSLFFFLSNQEVEQRYIINHYWSDFTPDYIRAHERAILGASYLNDYAHTQSENAVRKLLHLPLVTIERIPASVIDRVQREAKAIQAQPFEKVLQTYQVQYLVWDTETDPEWHAASYSSLSEQYRANDIVVYAVHERIRGASR